MSKPLPHMFNKIINNLILVLLILLPISNPIGQYLVNGLRFNQNILLWKEGVVVIIIALMLTSIIKNKVSNKSYFIGLWIIAWILVSFSSVLGSISNTSYILGFRFELFWLLFLAVGIDWVRLIGQIDFIRSQAGIYIGFGLSSILTTLTLIFGARPVLEALKYKDGIESGTNIINSAICHSINGLGDGCRLSGGMGNPNHYGAYLGMVLALFVYNIIKGQSKIIRIFSAIYTLFGLYFVWFNFARFVWLGLVLIIVIFTMHKLITSYTKPIVIGFLLLSTIGGFWFFSLPFDSGKYSYLPQFITKPGSSTGHYKQTNMAIDIIENKLPSMLVTGYGLGQAGTAAKETYVDVKSLKIYKENFQIADKYSTSRENLTVPENWFLQLIINGGVVYSIIYSVIALYTLRFIVKYKSEYSLILALGLFVVINGNIYLHLWESSVVSMYFVMISLIAISWEKNLSTKE